MIWVIGLLVVLVSGLVTGIGLRAAGVQRRMAVQASLAAGAAAGVVAVALLFTFLNECFVENRPPMFPSSWPWSPRRQFCDGGSPEGLGSLALLLVPAVAVLTGTLLRWKHKQALGWACYALLLAAPALPTLYLKALPYYPLDEYPILHEPLLRPASGSEPALVCYVYGVAHGPSRMEVLPNTNRTCVELKPTPHALSLTNEYDEGQTNYDLDWMGKELTQNGLPVRPGETGVPGLIVDRAHYLTDIDARP